MKTYYIVKVDGDSFVFTDKGLARMFKESCYKATMEEVKG